jgi:hypothetical protein
MENVELINFANFHDDDIHTIVSTGHINIRKILMVMYARHNLRACQKKFQGIWLVRCEDIAHIQHFFKLR